MTVTLPYRGKKFEREPYSWLLSTGRYAFCISLRFEPRYLDLAGIRSRHGWFAIYGSPMKIRMAFRRLSSGSTELMIEIPFNAVFSARPAAIESRAAQRTTPLSPPSLSIAILVLWKPAAPFLWRTTCDSIQPAESNAFLSS